MREFPGPPVYGEGNLVSDVRNGLIDEGRWVYLWDAENRLIQMESTAAAVTAGMPYTKLTFEYNWEGKRVARHVWRGGNSGSPTFLNSRRWLYEGWNPVVEFTGTSATAATGATAAALNRYTWGLDLGDAGEGIGRPGHLLQRAGGVGGLVLQTTISGGVMERPSYDGNGNIVAWTKSNASTPTSRREYDAFGNVVMSEGASPSAFGFSTKIEDAQTGLLYYGYRYYDPVTGRWQSRDPIEERGGVNLYGFALNDGVNRGDILGLLDWVFLQSAFGKDGKANDHNSIWTHLDSNNILDNHNNKIDSEGKEYDDDGFREDPKTGKSFVVAGETIQGFETAMSGLYHISSGCYCVTIDVEHVVKELNMILPVILDMGSGAYDKIASHEVMYIQALCKRFDVIISAYNLLPQPFDSDYELALIKGREEERRLRGELGEALRREMGHRKEDGFGTPSVDEMPNWPGKVPW
jgi:RHS repeat-associated protein